MPPLVSFETMRKIQTSSSAVINTGTTLDQKPNLTNSLKCKLESRNCMSRDISVFPYWQQNLKNLSSVLPYYVTITSATSGCSIKLVIYAFQTYAWQRRSLLATNICSVLRLSASFIAYSFYYASACCCATTVFSSANFLTSFFKLLVDFCLNASFSAQIYSLFSNGASGYQA